LSTQPREYNWGAIWRKNNGSALEIREYGHRNLSHWPHGTLYPQKLALSSLTSSGCLVGIVCSQTQATELSLYIPTGITIQEVCLKIIKKNPELHGLSPRANYTDRATAACRQSDCQLLRIEGATWSAWQIPMAVFSVF
jgi:hypothetical protein